MPLDYSHPRTIRFLKENYDKENENRISWFIKNKDEIIKTTTLSENHKGYHTEDVARALIEPIIPVLSLHHKVTKVNCLTKAPLHNIVIHKSTKGKDKHIKTSEVDGVKRNEEANMKPVDPNVTKILFEEHPTGGRREYLKVRSKVAPEDRYHYCETTNNVCGWRLNDSKSALQSSEYKRYSSIKKDTTSRTGPQPDPKHYSSMEEYSKCST